MTPEAEGNAANSARDYVWRPGLPSSPARGRRAGTILAGGISHLGTGGNARARGVSAMDEFDHSFGSAGENVGPFTILTYLIAFALCLTTCLLSFSEMEQVGPDIGQIVTFNPTDGPKRWEQAGIPALYAFASPRRPSCVLM